MRYIIILAIIGATAYFIFFRKKEQTVASPEAIVKTVNTNPLRGIFWQDMSGSIEQNGVDVINAETDFKPLFQASYQRPVEIDFGLIVEQSNKTLISLELLPPKFKQPLQPVRSGVSKIIFDNQVKEYGKRLAKYHTDSVIYFTKRNADSSSFINAVAKAIKNHKNARSTDFNICLDNTDRILNDRAGFFKENYAVFISDGINTNSNKLFEMKNKPVMIMVNRIAKGKQIKAVYDLMDYQLASVPEAINLITQN